MFNRRGASKPPPSAASRAAGPVRPRDQVLAEHPLEHHRELRPDLGLLVRGEDVNLPKTRSGPIQTDPNDAPLAITVKANGDVFIQQTQVDIDNLGPQVQAIIGEGYDKPIYVRGDEATPYGDVLNVMAEIKAAGYTRVALVTEQKKKK